MQVLCTVAQWTSTALQVLCTVVGQQQQQCTVDEEQWHESTVCLPLSLQAAGQAVKAEEEGQTRVAGSRGTASGSPVSECSILSVREGCKRGGGRRLTYPP